MMGRWIGWGGPYSFGFGWAGMFFNLVIFTLIIVLAVRFIRNSGVQGCCTHQTTGSNAEEILRERYAKGEISREQYHEILKELRN